MSPKHLKIATVIVALVILALIGLAPYAWVNTTARVPIPDEKAAGVELLAEKLTGPGYFSRADATEEEGTLWLGSDKVAGQFERVVAERRFSPSEEKKLRKLIEQLKEPQPSRLIGGERVNLVRLNLALDQTRE